VCIASEREREGVRVSEYERGRGGGHTAGAVRRIWSIVRNVRGGTRHRCSVPSPEAAMTTKKERKREKERDRHTHM
jgi:hypothetical protein